MSKKIISAILTIAMVVSMFATAFVTSVGAAAETTYAADRAALKEAIQTLYIKGATLKAETITMLKEMGILTWDKDNNRYAEEFTRTSVFGVADPDYKYFYVTAPTDAEVTAYNETVQAAAAAWYFGQDENMEGVDATWNAARNAAVKEATGTVNALLSSLKAQVGAGSAKPEKYAKAFAEYKNFAAKYALAYNQSIGINPYYSIITDPSYTVDSLYGSVLAQYPVRWYTFDEIRANADAADLLFAFEIALRDMALNNGAGVLYYDFKTTTYNDVTNALKAVCDALVKPVDVNFGSVDFSAQLKAYAKLVTVVDFYDTYIKDLYNNIYTATNAALLSNVLYAKQLIQVVGVGAGINSAKLFFLLASNIDDITNNIIAGIESNVVRNEQILSSAEIATGTATVNEAATLLKVWAHWASGNDAQKASYAALNNAMNVLKNMLPVVANATVKYDVAANTCKVKVDINGVIKGEEGNDAYSITFTPNYFAYVKYLYQLQDAIATFKAATAPSASLGAVDFTTDKSALLRNALNKYAYLFGVVGKVFNDDNTAVAVDKTSAQAIATELYTKYLLKPLSSPIASSAYDYVTYANYIANIFAALDNENNTYFVDGGDATTLYEKVVGTVFVADPTDWRNFDAAIDNVYPVMSAYVTGAGFLLGENTAYTNDVSFNWTTGAASFKSAYEKAVSAITDALKYLTADLTRDINKYMYILKTVADFFGWTYNTTGGYAVAATPAENYQAASSYPNKVMENAVKATNVLNNMYDRYVANSDGNRTYTRPTASSIVPAYDNFIAAVKVLLTETGAAKLDAFLNAVDNAVKAFYGSAYNNYDELYNKLVDSGESINNYLLTGAAATQPYVDFAFTLSVVMNDTAAGNRYNYANGSLNANLYDALAANIGTVDVSGVARDWAEDYDEVRKLAAGVVAIIDGLVANPASSDMPLWYALRVLDELNEVLAAKGENTVAALDAYKAELNALIAEAFEKNIWEYVTNSDETKAVWAEFVDAFNSALNTQYDARAPKDDIDLAALRLSEAMADLVKIEGASTVDTLNAAIADAEALIARADMTSSTAKKALEDAIYAAKKVMQFNINVMSSTDIDAEIAKLTAAMKTLTNDMYTAVKLAKDVKLFELKVVADLYTEVSYTMFANACADAYTTSSNDALKESEYEAARAKVESKFNGLKLAPVEVEEPAPEVPTVEEPKESEIKKQAVEVYNELAAEFASLTGYSAESTSALSNAIKALKAGIDSDATDATLISNIIAAKLARASLVVDNPNTCDD